MATKKKVVAPKKKTAVKKTTKSKEVARIELVCFSNDEVETVIDGDPKALLAALAGLLTDHDERNTFGALVKTAIELIVFKDITAEA